MIQIPVYTIEGKKVGTTDVSERVFGVAWNPDVVHQALVTQQANSRNTVAHAKGRGEVRGGGKKPWKQKGTGRARHGSIRSPLWVGGGVTHGPLKEKVYSRSLNKKMRQLALFSLLSKKYADEQVMIIDSFESVKPKTKLFSKAVAGLFSSGDRTVFVFSDARKALARALSNIPRTRSLGPRSLNVVDIAAPSKVFIEKDALSAIVEHYVEKTNRDNKKIS